MTRDFAKKPRATANKKHTSDRQNRSQVPGWVWLFTGTVLGAFIMFLAYLSGITPQGSSNPTSATNSRSDQNVVNAKNPTPKPRFDFYQLLKESEVVVKEPTPTDKKTTAPTAQEYILQVGSFKRSADADRLRAELILMNLDTHTETVKVRNGETWHRVLVGPFQSRSRLAKARSTLVSHDINPLLLKRKSS